MAIILNGRLPDTLLAPIPWARQQRIAAQALADLVALDAAFHAEFGHHLVINEAYRDLDRQWTYWYTPPSGVGTAAFPGTSNHGWGLAVDLHLTAAELAWMRKHAGEYGWVNPAWAQDAIGTPEPWHWEHVAARPVTPIPVATTTATPTTRPSTTLSEEDDDMIVITARNGVWTLQGSTLTGIGDIKQANELTAKGITSVTYNDADFDRLRAELAGRELIHNTTRGYAVGIPGARYIGLADMAEVNFHRGSGCRDREVSVATFNNLTA